MCADLLRKWLVLVICACGVAAAGEPAEPVEASEPWIGAEHLAPGWESMALTTRRFNPDLPASIDKTPQRSLSFTGQINVIDPNGLIGMDEVATKAIAFDEAGNRIQVVGVLRAPTSSEYPPTAIGEGYPPWGPLYTAVRYSTTRWVPTGEVTVSIRPYSFSIDMLMGYGASFPLILSRLEWTMSALLSDTFVMVDIPFAPTSDWVELVPGLEVLVEQAAASEGKHNYRLRTRYERGKVLYRYVRDTTIPGSVPSEIDTYAWPDQAPPEMVVTAIDVLNAEGDAIWRYSGGSRTYTVYYSDSEDRRIVTYKGSGNCPDCGRAAFIRHTIALKPYVQDVRLVLENVPVPAFWP
jgi:hypothetical protein